MSNQHWGSSQQPSLIQTGAPSPSVCPEDEVEGSHSHGHPLCLFQRVVPAMWSPRGACVTVTPPVLDCTHAVLIYITAATSLLPSSVVLWCVPHTLGSHALLGIRITCDTNRTRRVLGPGETVLDKPNRTGSVLKSTIFLLPMYVFVTVIGHRES